MPELSRRALLGAGLTAALPLRARAEAAEGDGSDTIHLRLNGAERTLRAHPEATAVEVIRDAAGLTGAKEVCGHGACGACAIEVDGVVVNGCLLPASRLEGRTVVTVEGRAAHVMARAFAAADGLQCGYCTPGFVVQAARWYEDRQAHRPGVEPTDGEVADALCGHLCRCAAYPGILRAVKDACAGRVPADASPVRVDAPEKVSGAAVYTTDVHLPGQLEARIFRSPHPHARLRGLDLATARAIPGVKHVSGLVPIGGRVRFRGQEVAAVAAVDRRAADRALTAIVADWEVLPHAIGFDAALAPDAPLVYPETHRDVVLAGEFPIPPTRWEGNRRGPIAASMFLAEGKARRSTPLVEGTWTTHAQSHTCLEPHACVADWRPDGLRVHVSTQAGWDLAADLAERFDLPRDAVQVLCPHVGGAFGAKSELEPHIAVAVELSRAVGLPVRLVLDREEELTVGGYRAAQRMRLRLAVAPDGAPEGLDVETEADSGVAIGANVGGLLRLVYPFAEKRLLDWDVVTFAPSARAFRAPSGPAACWALEGAIDEAATTLGIDPLALRARWDPVWAGLYGHVAALPAWARREPPGTGRIRRGVGVAAGGWYYVVQTTVEVEVEAGPTGLLVRAGGQDVGTGTRTLLATTLAEALGFPRDRIRVELGDSDLPRGPMAGGSRTTASYVPAVLAVAEALVDATARVDRRFLPGVGWTSAAGTPVPWDEVLREAGPLLVRSGRPRDQGGYAVPFGVAGFRMGRRMAGTVQLAEVEVDTWTGRVSVLGWSAHFKVGRLATPALARVQCLSGVLQGIGYTLHEERRTDADGRITTLNLEDYRLLGIGEVPPVALSFDETGFEHVGGGGIGLAEICTIPVAAAIGNAVAHATGVRFRDLPLRPDRVLAGLGR